MDLTRKNRISAFVICCNEEQDIERCLQSISWCDELIVVDSGSIDRTVELAKKFTSKVIHHDWEGWVKQKQFALSQCTHEWVLNIDSDEVLTPELREEIITTLNSDQANNYDGYELLRIVHFLGKFWRRGGWYPEYRLRLMQRSRVSWGGRDPHEKVILSGGGKSAKLKSELHHYTYENFAAQFRSLNLFSSVSAEALDQEGARASIGKVLVNPFTRFFKFYILKRGYREGLSGLYVAINEAIQVYAKYLKLWEIQMQRAQLQKEKLDSTSETATGKIKLATNQADR